MKRKNVSNLLLVVALSLCLSAAAHISAYGSEGEPELISVQVNGVQLESALPYFHSVTGAVMVPLRPVAEQLG
jgi:hypothetical protein